MKFFIDILKGMVIGLANIIPGVSGGTMMVSMGIYDTLIYCITHLFKQFKKSLMTLLPFVVGMVAALAILSNVITWALMDEFAALPTNTLFIGLILGGLPAILRQVKGKKKGAVCPPFSSRSRAAKSATASLAAFCSCSSSRSLSSWQR